jgi:hypothetical protein
MKVTITSRRSPRPARTDGLTAHVHGEATTNLRYFGAAFRAPIP